MFELTNFVLEWVITECKQMLEKEVFSTEDLLFISASDISRCDLNRRLYEHLELLDLQEVVVAGTGVSVVSLSLRNFVESLDFDIPLATKDVKSDDRQQWKHDLHSANQAGKRGSKHRGR